MKALLLALLLPSVLLAEDHPTPSPFVPSNWETFYNDANEGYFEILWGDVAWNQPNWYVVGYDYGAATAIDWIYVGSPTFTFANFDVFPSTPFPMISDSKAAYNQLAATFLQYSFTFGATPAPAATFAYWAGFYQAEADAL